MTYKVTKQNEVNENKATLCSGHDLCLSFDYVDWICQEGGGRTGQHFDAHHLENNPVSKLHPMSKKHVAHMTDDIHSCKERKVRLYRPLALLLFRPAT